MIEESHSTATRVLQEHMDELHKLSAILIERETIDKDQYERLLAGEDEESVFADDAGCRGPCRRRTRSASARPQPKPRPFPLPRRDDAAASARKGVAGVGEPMVPLRDPSFTL